MKLKNLKKDNIKKVSFIGENKFDISKIKLIDKYNKCFLVEKNDWVNSNFFYFPHIFNISNDAIKRF